MTIVTVRTEYPRHAMTDVAPGVSVVSPDGKNKILFSVEDGFPLYSVVREGKTVILPSGLGFRLYGAPDLLGPFRIVGVEHTEVNDIVRPVCGITAEVINHYHQAEIRLVVEREPGRSMNLVFRAYDDGVAFRYVIPEQEGQSRLLIWDEETLFRFAGDYTAWWIPDDYDGDEWVHRRTPLSAIETEAPKESFNVFLEEDPSGKVPPWTSKSGRPGAVNTPITMKTDDGTHVVVHEAGLIDYAAMTLAAMPGQSHSFRTALVPWPDGIKVRAELPCRTPWRSIHLVPDAGALLTSPLIQNLNEPSRLEETSFVRPMTYTGIWWGMHVGKLSWSPGPNHGATTERSKEYIDFTARHGIGGFLVEGWNRGWERWAESSAYAESSNHISFTEAYDDFDLEEVARYARSQGVDLIGHHETEADIPGYERQMEAAFELYRKVGVRAVKTGYVGKVLPLGHHHHGQYMVRHFVRVLETAARYGLMIDAHEPVRPTGLERTYPNLMTSEAVRGGEYEAWSKGNPPGHTVTLPFTRMVAGPLDYTPGIFDLLLEGDRPPYRVHTTLARQLSLYVILYSPLQMIADLPENYEGHPAFAFLEQVPTTWDETVPLVAEVGEFVAVARRKGTTWYLGAATDEFGRTLELPLAFLDPGRTYRVTLYEDGPEADWESNPQAYSIRTLDVERGTILFAVLAPGGGMAARIEAVLNG